MSDPKTPAPLPDPTLFAILIIQVGGKIAVMKPSDKFIFPYFSIPIEGMLPGLYLKEQFAKLMDLPQHEVGVRLDMGNIHQFGGIPRKYTHTFSIEMTRPEVQGLVNKGMPLMLINIPDDVDPSLFLELHLNIYRHWEKEF